mmetsp:Transcript_29188/g.42830  ORF Transcript_29188/g.42830 Transcript_29188/m.42830 type:complete len:83 (+) Transcript_29188:45-293(+)
MIPIIFTKPSRKELNYCLSIHAVGACAPFILVETIRSPAAVSRKTHYQKTEQTVAGDDKHRTRFYFQNGRTIGTSMDDQLTH